MKKCLTLLLALMLLLVPRGGAAAQRDPHYLVMGPLYPFTDLNNLTQAAELCYQNALPFVLLVAPVYQNTEFPAMDRFCTALKYAQSRGGTVLMRQAIILAAEREIVPLEQKLDLALEGYARYDIHPARTQVEDTEFDGDLWYDPSDSLDVLEQTVLQIHQQRWGIQDYAAEHGIAASHYDTPADPQDFVWQRGFQSAYASQVFAVDRGLLAIVTVFSIILLAIIALGFRVNRSKNLSSAGRRSRGGRYHGRH